MKSSFLILIELAYTAFALLFGSFIALRVDIISSVLPTKGARFSDSELLVIVLVYVIVSAPIFVIFRFTNRGMVFFDSRRTVSELYAVVLAASVSSTSIFLFTTVNFDPNFFLVAFLLTVLFFVLTLFLVSWKTRQNKGSHFEWLRSVGLIKALRVSPFSLSALLILIVAVLPVALAFSYKKSPDVANFVNRTRAYFVQSKDVRWTLENAYPGITFQRPMIMQFSPGPDPEPYVLERPGRIIKVLVNGVVGKELVLDFRNQVGEVKIENGALGFAFHPRFGVSGAAQEGFVFVYYTHVEPGSQVNRLSRFDLAKPSLRERLASETVLIEQQRTTSGVHNGGSVEFGPDSFLYLAIGDGFSAVNHQRIDRDLFSGILRIDVDMRGGDVSHPIVRQPANGRTQGYFIPNDNPFSGREDSLEEFWAIGLRNPFRVSFDIETGYLWTGDVGKVSFEEINKVERGGNYEWPYREGPDRNPKVARPENPIGIEIAPFFYYGQSALDRVIIGGVVYRGEKFPQLVGKYIFADNFSGRISVVGTDASVELGSSTLAFADYHDRFGLTSFTLGSEGDIYLTILGDPNGETGKIVRLVELTSIGDEQLLSSQNGGRANLRETTLTSAREIYVSSCARCHGDDGRGDGPQAVGLEVRPPDFSAGIWQRDSTDEDIARVIEIGGAAAGLSEEMPAWDGVLTTGEIGKLVDVIRMFSRDFENGPRGKVGP